MHVSGPRELLEDVIQRDLCIGCGACVDLCPYFKNHLGKTAMLFPCDLPQGRCHAFCPKVEVDLDELAAFYWGRPYDGGPLGRHREVLISRAGQRVPAAAFQAGGTVSALVLFALESGRIEAAALTDRADTAAVGRLVSRPEDVLRCASSKYMAAPTLAVLNHAARRGRRRLGLVGTPCQVTSAAQMRTNPLEKKDFQDPISLVVGLFCTWALDARKLAPVLRACVGDACVLGMDMPPPPAEVMVVNTGADEVRIPLEQIRPLIPKACHICPDMTSEWADLSVGVLEGRPRWNTLIVRTAAGEELVRQARGQGYLVCEKMPTENLAHLCRAAADKKKRALQRALREGLLNSPADRGRAAIRLQAETVKRILAADTEESCHD